MRSTPAETGGSHLDGRRAMLSTSIWKTITEGTYDDQEASEARLAAHAPRRASARRDFAGPRPAKDRDRQAARRVASDAVRHSRGKAAGHSNDGPAAREAVRQRSRSLAQSAEAVRSSRRRREARNQDQRHSDLESTVINAGSPRHKVPRSTSMAAETTP